MSDLTDLETMAALVGFKYASVSISTETREVTLQCEDHDGNTLTATGVDITAAMSAMMVTLGSMMDQEGQTWQA
jgi:hypothetical protein